MNALVGEIVVGLLSGFGGAAIGAWMQQRLHTRDYRRVRDATLADLERTLRMTAERLMDERSGRADSNEVEAAFERAYPYFPSLPRELVAQLEADDSHPQPGGLPHFEVGENLAVKADALRAYIDGRKPKSRPRRR